ncbi:MAG: DUF3783 domain-containing protein [Eubacteriales bacterium]|nr:DUF3783 domain-containing protein [Eubacteriales bacterium]
MKPPVLLCYNLTGDKAAKIKFTAMRFAIRIRVVKPEEYTQTLAALCGLEEPNDQFYSEAGFEDEMLVMAHFPDALTSQFLQAFHKAKVAPVLLKAILTDTNADWNSLQLHQELSAEREAILNQSQPLHAQKKAE